MEDRRQQIIDTGLALLREDGLPGLTQPKIAARTGLRQSHLTYYYPTRSALLAAVARAAIDIQIGATRAMIARITSIADAAGIIAGGTARPENTRVLLALAQAADREPEVRALFNELANTSGAEIKGLYSRLGLEPDEASADLLLGMVIGLSVVHLSTGREMAEARSHKALATAFSMLAAREPKPNSR